jgi:hypothetical protein
VSPVPAREPATSEVLSGHDGGQAGNELRDEHAPGPEPGEDALGAAHAGIRVERQATQARQHARSTASAQLVPSEVHGQRHDGDRSEHQGDAAAPVGGQGTDAPGAPAPQGAECRFARRRPGREESPRCTAEKLKAVHGVHILSWGRSRGAGGLFLSFWSRRHATNRMRIMTTSTARPSHRSARRAPATTAWISSVKK